MFAIWSYRNSSVLVRSSGTEQLHSSNSVKFSLYLLQYHRLTASLWLVQCCHLYWVRRIQVTSHCENSKVSSNIIPPFYDSFQIFGQTSVVNFHPSETSHTHHIPHSPKAHYNSLHPLLTSPSHPQYLPQNHKSHSPKALYNSLHPPVNFSI